MFPCTSFLRPVINNIWCCTKHTHFELIQFIKSCYCHVKTKLSVEVCSCFNSIKTDSRHKQVFFMLLFLCYIINGSSFSKFWHCAFFNFTSLIVPHSSERIICLRVFIKKRVYFKLVCHNALFLLITAWLALI